MSSRQASRIVYVALSGGVDSAVAASRVVRAGHRVVGVFMRPWQPPGVRCLWEREREDALRVASHLNIPFLDWDFSRQYGRSVADPMVRDYRAGRTPNPDVECNRHIKFGLFAARAFKDGADMIATGHYARIVRRDGRLYLAAARDTNKDQTYFLWAIPPRVLDRTLFPVGGMTKAQVRAHARRVGLSVAQKKDSQGVCFVGDLDVKGFLASRITPRSGRIVHRDGRELGTHDGAAFYTIGQRHGLNITTGGGPFYVCARDVRRNVITVGDEQDLYSTEARIRDTRWFGDAPETGSRIQVKIRYRTPAVPAVMQRGGRIRFLRPVRAAAPGQSAVIYRRALLWGGGILA
ncbi:MAG TPA: tRNA 2-thiouridine(34) synthase MnmA [Candidatus Paceibacterota bacterium]|nr:tRNA 2-thiouridine(34) synthase MnmA [Candidatus Paceibacterota bacterium]